MKCPECGSEDWAEQDCPDCDGFGWWIDPNNTDEDVDCERCGGFGTLADQFECVQCGATWDEQKL